MTRLVVEGDLIVSVVSGDVDGMPIPINVAPAVAAALSSGDMAGMRGAIARLRFVDGEFIDVAGAARTFYIDGFGRKHAVNGPDRVPLKCPHDARLERDGDGGWMVAS